MKPVTAITRPVKLAITPARPGAVRQPLTAIGIEGVTDCDVEGDRKIFAAAVEHTVRIRTGATDASAI